MPTTTVTDTDNAFAWTQRVTVSDDTGFLLSQTTTYDDGRIVAVSLVDGVIRTKETTYAEGAIVLTSSLRTFDGQGRLASISDYIGVDVKVSATFEDGILTGRTENDLTNAQAWTTRVKTYDTEGRLAETQTEFDDGRDVTTSYVDGIRASKSVADTENAYGWTGKSFIYDEVGRVKSTVVTHDDGDTTVTEHENGVRILRVETDGSATKDWSSKVFEYSQDTGTLTGVTTYFDDGTSVFSGPVTGSASSTRLRTDGADIHAWTTIQYRYDAFGLLEESVHTFDDGRLRTTTYENGNRAQVLWGDTSDAYRWDTRLYEFDDAGRLEQSNFLFDDGRRAVVDYEDGVKTSRQLTDTADAYDWATRVSDFDPSGLLSARVVTFDNGDVARFSFANGTKTSKTFSDFSDTRQWDSRFTRYDELGRVKTVSTTHDDGREFLSTYVDGARVTRERIDHSDVRSWQSIREVFDSETSALSYKYTHFDDGSEVYVDARGLAVVASGTTGETTKGSAAILETSGTIGFVDGYRGATEFVAETSVAGANGYGHFVLTQGGTWTYAADPSHATIQALGAGETLTDSFVAVTADGVETVVTVDIVAPEISPDFVWGAAQSLGTVGNLAPDTGSVDLNALFSHADGVAVTTTAAGLPAGVVISDGVLSVTDPSDLSLGGDHVIYVTATDGLGNSKTVELTLAISLQHDFGDGFHSSALDGAVLNGSSVDDVVTFGLQVGSNAGLTVDLGAGNDKISFAGVNGSLDNWSGVTVTGGLGDDTISGGVGIDTLDGGAGTDTVSYEAAVQGVQVDLRSDLNGLQEVNGGSGDIISGFEAVMGSAFDDTLIAGRFMRTMTGGEGADRFVLSTAPLEGLHVVTDFDAAQDIIELDRSTLPPSDTELFGQLGGGPVFLGAYFASNTTGIAETNETRIIYNEATGVVTYDLDGTEMIEAIELANIGAGLTLSENNFQFVDLYQRTPVANDVAFTIFANQTELLRLPLEDLNFGEILTLNFVGSYDGSATIVYPGYMKFNPLGEFDHLREGESVTQMMTYSIIDEAFQQDFGTVELTILGVEDAPIVGNDSAVGTEDTDLVIFPLGNDSDPDQGGVLLIDTVDPVDEGTVTIAPDGQSITFSPNPQFHGPVTLFYNVIDDSGTSSRGEISVTIASVEDAPVAQDMVAAVDEDASIVLVPDFVDFDVEDTPSIVVDTTGLVGSATVQADGTILYTASNLDALVDGEIFTETFSYSVIDDDYSFDGSGDLVSTADVTVTVTGRDDAPLTAADSFVFAEGTAAVLRPLSNDTDLDDGEFLRITDVFGVENGTVEIRNNTEIVYTPDLYFNGQTQFEYEVRSTNGVTTTEEITLDFTPVNNRPLLNGPIPAIDIDPRIQDVFDGPIPDGRATFAFSDIFTDPDGDALNYEVLYYNSSDNYNEARGTITLVDDLGDGRGPGFHYDAPIVVSTRVWGADVTEQFFVRATDPDGEQDFGILDVNIARVEYAPRQSGSLDTVRNLPEGSTDVAMGLRIFDGNGSDTATITGLRNTSANGTFEIAPGARDIIYTPDDGFWGPGESFQFQLTDNTGLTSPWMTHTFAVQPIIDTPDISLEFTATDRFDQFVVTLTAHSNEDERLTFDWVDLHFEDADGNEVSGSYAAGRPETAFLNFDGDNGWGAGITRGGAGRVNKNGETITTTEEYLVNVPEQYLDLLASGELTVVGTVSTVGGHGYATTKKAVGVTTTTANVEEVVGFQDASLWAPEDAGRQVQGYDLGGTASLGRSFKEDLFIVDARAAGFGVTSHVAVGGDVDVEVTAVLRPEVWIEGGSIDGGVGFDASVKALRIEDTGSFGFVTSAAPNANKSWFQAESPNSGFDISLTDLGFAAEGFLSVFGYAHVHTGTDTYGPEFGLDLKIPKVGFDVVGDGVSIISHDGQSLSLANGLIEVAGTSFAKTFRSPAQSNELGYVGLQKPNLTVTGDDVEYISEAYRDFRYVDGFYVNTKTGEYGSPLTTTGITGTSSTDFANLQLDLDGIAATIKNLKNPVDINESRDLSVIDVNARFEALDLDLRADFAYGQTNSLLADSLFGRIKLENGAEIDFEFGDVVNVGLIEDYDTNGDGQVAYQVQTRAKAHVVTEADVNMKFYDYFAVLNASGSVTTNGVAKEVLDTVGLPSSYTIGTNGPLFERSGLVLYKNETLDFADSAYLMTTDWNDADWSFA